MIEDGALLANQANRAVPRPDCIRGFVSDDHLVMHLALPWSGARRVASMQRQ
jgi:hypothetical protein